MSDRFDGVLFDIGGVLEDTPPTNWQHEWCRRLAIDLDALAARLWPVMAPGTTGEASLDEIHDGVREVLALSQDQLEAFMDDLWTEYLGTPNGDLIDYFASLRHRFVTGILSNSFVGAREREREKYGFERMCNVVVYSHEEGMSKPDPDIYLLACDRLGVEPARTVFVDDTDEMLAGAHAVGITTVKFVGQHETISAIEGVLNGTYAGWSPAQPDHADQTGPEPDTSGPEGGLRH